MFTTPKETAEIPASSLLMRACITIDSAPPEASHTVTSHDGTLRLVTRVSGTLADLRVNACTLVSTIPNRRIEVRMVLPPCVCLKKLEGTEVTIFTTLELAGEDPSGLEASILSPAGNTLVWVRDGSLPAAGGPFGVAWDGDAVRLGGQKLKVGVPTSVEVKGGAVLAVLLHCSGEARDREASLVVSRI